MKSPPALVLASTSVYRRQLLGRLGIPFECESPGVDETRSPAEPAEALVVRLARAKARAVGSRHPAAWTIGSDQTALLDPAAGGGTILGKPGSRERCIEQLRSCSGRTLSFLTAVAVCRESDGSLFECLDTTRVTFRALDGGTIERYVDRESPLDCAGGFKSEALGISLCESIASTDPTALVGLPLIELSRILRSLGFDLP